ncbi:MAG: DUF962 domain-containing protein [Proteobacteria bacterium]|nr:DUF962 domain-containing protein [Pseudomonadota bacterium]MCP4920430.1 DUF962 domain-containing protein [Pseudomonadota bacterium]
MRTATEWFELYGQSHTNGTNKLIHWICIPIILLNTLGLAASIPFPWGDGLLLNWASIGALFAVVFYFRLSWTIGLGMTAIAATALAINAALVTAGVPLLWFSLAVFFVAWVFQFIGHKVEGKKPSFFQDIQFLLVGPAWLLQFVYKKLGVPIETWAAGREALTR